MTGVQDGIHKPKELIERIQSGDVAIYQSRIKGIAANTKTEHHKKKKILFIVI